MDHMRISGIEHIVSDPYPKKEVEEVEKNNVPKVPKVIKDGVINTANLDALKTLQINLSRP